MLLLDQLKLLYMISVPATYSQSIVGGLNRVDNVPVPKCCQLGSLSPDFACTGSGQIEEMKLAVGGTLSNQKVQFLDRMPSCPDELEVWYPDWSESLSQTSSMLQSDGILIHENFWFRNSSYCVDYLSDPEYEDELTKAESVVVLYCQNKGNRLQKCADSDKNCMNRCCEIWSELDSDPSYCNIKDATSSIESTLYRKHQLNCPKGTKKETFEYKSGRVMVNELPLTSKNYCVDRNSIHFCDGEILTNSQEATRTSTASRITTILVSLTAILVQNK